MRNYYVNEGNKIGGQEPQALGTDQKRIKASAAITKGQLVEVSGQWTLAPASEDSVKVVGVAFLDAEIGENVSIDTEGFVKMDFTGTVNPGDKLVSAGAGKVKAKASSTGDVIGTAYATDGTVVYTKITL